MNMTMTVRYIKLQFIFLLTLNSEKKTNLIIIKFIIIQKFFCHFSIATTEILNFTK